MAGDKVVAMQASKLFGEHANFKAQRSSDSDLSEYAHVQDADGDTAGGCTSDAMDDRNEYSGTTQYCGTDIVSDAGTLLTSFGLLAGAKVPTEISFTFSRDNMPEMTIVGHNHDDNAHAASPAMRAADVSSVIPGSTGGVGVPAILENSDTDADPVSATVRFSLEHVDENGATNQHFVGNNKNFRCDITITYLGTPTLTTTGWIVPSLETADDNNTMDAYTISAYRFFSAS